MLCYARNHVNQVTGISKCQESPNCGQNDKKTRFSLEPAVDRQAREAKPSQAKPADGSAGRLRCGPSTIWGFFPHQFGFVWTMSSWDSQRTAWCYWIGCRLMLAIRCYDQFTRLQVRVAGRRCVPNPGP